jgi:hypothetical protein
MLQKLTGFIIEHFGFVFSGDSALKQHEQGITKSIPLFCHIAQIKPPQDRFFFSLVGYGGFSAKQWFPTHVPSSGYFWFLATGMGRSSHNIKMLFPHGGKRQNKNHTQTVKTG